ncbi:hypothetical protein NQ317_008599, partial [Molorchus minor]
NISQRIPETVFIENHYETPIIVVQEDDNTDIIGPPDASSNLRPIVRRPPINETALQRKLHDKIENLLNILCKRMVKAADVEKNLVSAFEATTIDPTVAVPSTSREVAGPSSETHSESAMSSRSTSRTSGASVEAENYFLRQELEQANEQIKNLKKRFSFEQIKNNDAHVLMYTGIPTSALFSVLFETMEPFKINYYAGWQVKLLPRVDQLLMTLMKLRLNLPHEDLAIRFNCSSATVTNIVMTWIYALHDILFKQLMKTIPSRKKNQACLPVAFSNFKNCRIILDCTEIYSAIPTSMENQRLTYSSYKHRNTWKVLVGVAPNGVITFVSKAYPGSTSDKKIVEHSEILKQMNDGDLILADKGFLIKDLLPSGERQEYIDLYCTKNDEKHPTADDMSEFYKKFLDDNWETHVKYNFEWYKKNATALFWALRVSAENVFRKT